MRKTVCLFAWGVIAMGLFAAHPGSQAKPASGFDRLKTLVGEWQGKGPEGTLTNTIRLVSNGTAIEETFQSADATQMVTLYTPDGSRLAMTHYCSAGNQPRMRTDAMTGDQMKFEFSFAGITNLMNSDSGHMRQLVIQIGDNDHFTEQWTWHEKGRDRTETFHFTRGKS